MCTTPMTRVSLIIPTIIRSPFSFTAKSLPHSFPTKSPTKVSRGVNSLTPVTSSKLVGPKAGAAIEAEILEGPALETAIEL